MERRRIISSFSGVAANLCDIGINDKTVSGFDIECETAAATSKVDLIIVGEAAE